MTTALLSAPRRFVLLAAVVSAYRRWRNPPAKRVLCRSCEACGRPIAADITKLFKAGYHQAAVCLARLVLEKELASVALELPAVAAFHSERKYGRSYIPLLIMHGLITERQAARIIEAYGRASRIVHGEQCTPETAKEILLQLRAAIRFLSSKPTIQCQTKGIAKFHAKLAGECGQPVLAVAVEGGAA